MWKDILLLVLSFITGLLIAFISFKYFRKRIKKFSSTLYSKEDIGRFIKFITEDVKLDDIFLIDINLDDKQAEEFRNDFSASFPEFEDGILMSGWRVFFFKEDESNMYVDMRPSANKIRGYFKVNYMAGPQHGWFTIGLKYVQLENIYNNI